MNDGMDYVMRPILRAGGAMYCFESLKDGTLSLADVAICNEAMDVMAENERRARDATTR